MVQVQESDLELARRIADGDEDAAAELLQRLGGEMYGYAHRMLEDSAAAEDALQEALMGVLQSADRYDGRASLRSWAFGILRHKITDQLRRRNRHSALSLDDPESAGYGPMGMWRKGVQFEPFDESAELLEIVKRCMENLPAHQKEALMLRAVEGLSAKEAAEIMEVSYTNLRMILHRGRQSVRRCTESHTGGTA